MCYCCLREEGVGYVEGEGGEEYKAHKNAEKTAPFKSYPQGFVEGPVIYHVPWLSPGGGSRVCRGRGLRGSPPPGPAGRGAGSRSGRAPHPAPAPTAPYRYPGLTPLLDKLSK